MWILLTNVKKHFTLQGSSRNDSPDLHSTLPFMKLSTPTVGLANLCDLSTDARRKSEARLLTQVLTEGPRAWRPLHSLTQGCPAPNPASRGSSLGTEATDRSVLSGAPGLSLEWTMCSCPSRKVGTLAGASDGGASAARRPQRKLYPTVSWPSSGPQGPWAAGRDPDHFSGQKHRTVRGLGGSPSSVLAYKQLWPAEPSPRAGHVSSSQLPVPRAPSPLLPSS